MKKSILLLTIFTFTFMLFGCNLLIDNVDGKGEVIEKTYNLDDATELDIKNIKLWNQDFEFSPNVTINSGEEKKVIITSQENIINKLSVVVTNDKELRIYGDKGERYVTDNIKIDIYGYVFDDIDLSFVDATINEGTYTSDIKLDVSGASDVDMPTLDNITLADIELSGASKMDIDIITGNKLELDISGASSMLGDTVEIDILDLSLSGASKVDFTGSTDQADLDLSGASTCKFESFDVTDADIDVSGASTLLISVIESMSGEASGGSTVKYTTDDATIKVDVSGASSLKKN